MHIAGSPQTPALGAAMSAAVAAGRAAGGHDSFDAAQSRMTTLKAEAFAPDPDAHAVYDALYGIYRELHDTFGGQSRPSADLGSLMKRLLAVRERAVVRSVQVANA
jgi:L-ribulokinase